MTSTATGKRQAYNSVWQLRADAWANLQEAASRLAAQHIRGRPTERLAERAAGLVGQLSAIEQYWGFPGRHRFEQVRRLLDAGEFERFARTVGGLNRELTTDSFRTGVTRPAEGHEWSVPGQDVGALAERPALRRPYFEVLVVEDMTPPQEQALRAELYALRKPEDEFVYELVVVPSFDDAVTAVQFNFSLQACVIRSPVEQRSRHDLSGLRQFVDTAATDREDEADDAEERSSDERAQALGRRLRALRPELDLYLMTVVAVEEVAGRLSRDFRRVFHAREGSLELHLSILQGVEHRYRTPFFSALREYSQQADRGVPRAADLAAASRSSTRTGSRTWPTSTGWTSSWPRPPRPAAGWTPCWSRPDRSSEAQELAAAAFGARQTFFVTNGTSTANKIVVQALVQPGDIVLVDRELPQVAPLRAGAGRRAGDLPGRLPAERVLDVRRGAAAARSSASCWRCGGPASWTGSGCCC